MNKFLPIMFVILLANCTTITKPEEKEKKLIAESVNLSYDLDYLDTIQVLDLDFDFQYYFVNSGGQLTEYSFKLKDIKSGFGISSGWQMRFEANRPPATIRFYEPGQMDTLSYSKLFQVEEKDTLYKEFTFILKGFFCDSQFRNAEDTLILDPFEYIFKDTINILP